MTARYAAQVAYDGSAYQGFQRQAGDAPTIQRALETAIAAVTGQSVRLIGAGRTDTGVHAIGQVIAFDVAWKHGDDDLLNAINAVLPDDIALQAVRRREGFHPRYDALSREYRYTVIEAQHRQPLLRQRAWHVRGVLNGEAMALAAGLLLGEHDFATFGRPPQGENTVRTVLASAWAVTPEAYGRCWVYTVEANAFLQHMVRRLVGALVEVGRGGMTVEEFVAAFRAATLLGAQTLAPPQGLVLTAVRYPNFGFSEDELEGSGGDAR